MMQPVDLGCELVEGAIVVDHDVRFFDALQSAGLVGDPCPRIGLGEIPTIDKSPDGDFRVDVDDDEQFEIAATGFDQQWDVEHHESIGRSVHVQPPADLGTHRRMHDGIEDGELLRIGEHPCCKSGAVERAIVEEEFGAERLDDRRKGGLTRGLDLTGDRVGVDDFVAQLAQHDRDRAFAATDSSGEAHEVHGSSSYPAKATPSSSGRPM